MAGLRRLDPRRLLFVGDSLTYVNDLDVHLNRLAVVAQMADAAQLAVQRVVQGGAPLSVLWKRTNAQSVIESGKWDVVVLQEDLPETSVAHFEHFGTKFHQIVRGRTVLLAAWHYDRLQWIDTDGIAAAHSKLAEKLGGDTVVAPVGLAWQRCAQVCRAVMEHRLKQCTEQEFPEIELYHEDREHPSPAGTVLAAAVLFCTLWDRNPEGLSYAAPVNTPVDAGQMEVLHSIAWATWQQVQA